MQQKICIYEIRKDYIRSKLPIEEWQYVLAKR